MNAIQFSFQEELEIKQDSTKEYLGKLQYKVGRDLVLTPYHRRTEYEVITFVKVILD